MASTIFLCLAIAAFAGAGLTFLFGVVVTKGVYGSRIAWLMGVTVPLFAIAAVLAVGASRAATTDGPAADGTTPENGSHGVRAAKTIAGISFAAIATPFVLAAMILALYGLIFAVYWLRH
jgi:hypothetical protein